MSKSSSQYGPKIAFIGAGSTVFMKNIVGDILQKSSSSGAHISLMDIDSKRLEESGIVLDKIIKSLNVKADFSLHSNQKDAISGANFVITAFQIGGYDPCTITDFEIPKKYGLRQTIGDTLGIGGIMRGLRTVPHLWKLCEDMLEVCPDALMLQYVNPMAINTMAISAKYPQIRQVGLCHSIQHTIGELATDLQIPKKQIRYFSAGINHLAYFLRLEEVQKDGSFKDLYPELKSGYLNGLYPRVESQWNQRCPNKVRYEMMMKLGYFVTESSEHFAEYVPWLIKTGHEELISKFGIPLDEYPKRCEEQIEEWKSQIEELREANTIEITKSDEYASEIIDSMWTGNSSVIYGNVLNNGFIPTLPKSCAIEVPCLVDRNGIQPTVVENIPPQLISIMRTNINVQELVVEALLTEKREHIYHAAMFDPHTSAELNLDQIWSMVDELISAHGNWLPEWVKK